MIASGVSSSAYPAETCQEETTGCAELTIPAVPVGWVSSFSCVIHLVFCLATAQSSAEVPRGSEYVRKIACIVESIAQGVCRVMPFACASV